MSTSSAPPPPRIPPERFVGLAVRFYGLLALAALAWRWGWAGEPIWFAGPEGAARGIRPLLDPAVGLAAAAGVIALSREFTRRTRAGEALARALGRTLGPLDDRQILVLAALSGVAEELFFRGALQPRVGWVAASLLFGVVHFVPQRAFLPWTAFSIAAGFLLGGLFEWTGNLVAPVVAHFTVNAVNLRRLVRDYGGAVDAGETGAGGEASERGDRVDLDPGPER